MKTLNQAVMVLFSTAISTFAIAQTATTIDQPYIEVTGTAERCVVPDEIYIGITIYDKYVHNTREKVTIEEQELKLKEAIKTQGISLANLYLSDAASDYVKVNWKKSEVLTKKNFTLKVTDAVLVGKVFQELDRLEIKDARISKVSHSKMDSLRREVRIAAIKAAKEKADYMLAAIGEQTGKPLIVKENEPAYYNSESNVYIRNSNSFSGSSNYTDLKTKVEEEPEIQFQKIRVASNTYVKFLIK